MNETTDEQALAEELHARRDDPNEWEEEPEDVDVRPSKTEVVSFRLPTEVLDRLEQAADERGETVSQLLRRLVLHRFEEDIEQLVDVASSGSGLSLTVRTALSSPGHTENPGTLIPNFPPRTATGRPAPPDTAE